MFVSRTKSRRDCVWLNCSRLLLRFGTGLERGLLSQNRLWSHEQQLRKTLSEPQCVAVIFNSDMCCYGNPSRWNSKSCARKTARNHWKMTANTETMHGVVSHRNIILVPPDSFVQTQRVGLTWNITHTGLCRPSGLRPWIDLTLLQHIPMMWVLKRTIAFGRRVKLRHIRQVRHHSPYV